MQAVSQSVQAINWAGFATEAVKILGPALLALMGSWIALRYQRRMKEIEINSQVALKVRELISEGYFKKTESQTKDLKKLARATGQLMRSAGGGNKDEIEKAVSGLAEALAAAANPLLADSKMIELELKSVGLSSQYEKEIEFIKKFDDKAEDVDKDDPEAVHGWARDMYKAINYINVINQDVLERRREKLFEEYLPAELRSSRSETK